MTSPSPAIQAVPEKDGLFYAPEAESPGTYAHRPGGTAFQGYDPSGKISGNRAFRDEKPGVH